MSLWGLVIWLVCGSWLRSGAGGAVHSVGLQGSHRIFCFCSWADVVWCCSELSGLLQCSYCWHGRYIHLYFSML
jgi:hypothetical protein